ncbi:MAG: ComEC/Rec2 family competence protein [Candidatus Moranbacteria bacterium]|nr:ComEC/Rec2 family competence protein [Candidatus Moranbacteria bacterium]MBP6034410.1 ComEC/Rec2 family competence protein [Candidatus Moranbacteria bacterium]MBP7695963.1 ComEC/Rec2 family competence protein [Candidatus Moranbacteria bacterium]
MKRWLLPILSGSFVAGVALGSLMTFQSALVFGCLAGVVIVAAVAAFQSRLVVLFLVSGGLFISGVLLVSDTTEQYQALSGISGVSGSGTIRGEMDRGVYDARVVVALDDCGSEACPRESVQLRVDRFSEWSDGMRVRIGPCDFKRPRRFDPEFDYPMYLAKEGIGFVAERCPMERIAAEDSYFRTWLSRARVSVAERIAYRLPEPEAGLARGLLLGGSDELPDSVADAFRTVGLSHIVAVSGYNISVLAGGLFLLGILLGWYRKQAVWLTLLGIVLFVCLVGAPASAVRAALMAGIAFFALLAARPADGLSLLCVAGALMLAVNPLLLRYDIGFQLSFAATFAILISAPRRAQIHYRSWIVGSVMEMVFITSTVLIFVIPLSLFHFGTLSPYALLSNVLVLPLVPVAFLLSFAIVLLGWVPGLGAGIGWLGYGALHGALFLGDRLSALPGAGMTFSGVAAWMVGCWYLGWVLFFVWRNNR